MICGSCHSVDSQNRVAGSNGWISSKQQFAEWTHSSHNTASPHYGYLTCATCHNQHKSTVYDQGGVEEHPTCSSCHPDHVIPGKEYLPCIGCHMPYSVKSSTERNAFRADMRSHQFRIWISPFPKDSMFYTDSTGVFLKLDSEGKTYGNTLDLACLRCHRDWSIADVYPIAENIHQEGLEVNTGENRSSPYNFNLTGNFPNPFNSTTAIEFSLAREGRVTLAVFDINGKLVNKLLEGILPSGRRRVVFNAESLPSGLYFCRLVSPQGILTKKMILLK